MKNLNSFYVIGSLGTIITAFLHIVLSLIIDQSSLHVVFIGLYPTFITFLLIGGAQLKLASTKIPIPSEKRKKRN